MIYLFCCFFFNDTATPKIYTLSLHDALPISSSPTRYVRRCCGSPRPTDRDRFRQHLIDRSIKQVAVRCATARSEEHTSELQSQFHLVCRLLLEKKKYTKYAASLQSL